jgi:hypothetical protein
MTVNDKDVDRLHEKLDKLDEKLDNIINSMTGIRERLAKVESFQGFIKVGLSLAIPASLAIAKLFYDITRSM